LGQGFLFSFISVTSFASCTCFITGGGGGASFFSTQFPFTLTLHIFPLNGSAFSK